MSEHRIPRYLGPDTSYRKDKMTPQEIKARFDREVASMYSKRDPAWLPEFTYVFNLVPELVAPYLKNGDRFLDIGAGTGNLTRAILEKIDSVKATLIDFSPNMLAEVPNVLSDFKERYDTIIADFTKEEFPRNTYSAVVSSFAIHHCRGQHQYLALYKKIHSSLKKKGIFVCCDVVSGSDELLSHQNELGWASFLKDRGFSTDEVDKVLSNYHVEDSPESVWTHMRLLKEAGFTTVDVIWRKYNFSVYVGISD